MASLVLLTSHSFGGEHVCVGTDVRGSCMAQIRIHAFALSSPFSIGWLCVETS